MPGPPDTPCCRAARACSPTLCVNPNPARRGGPQVVVTAADASEAPAGRMDAAALDRIAIRVSPRVFGTRIRCVREEADVAKEVRRPPGPRAGGWNAGGGALGLCRLWEAEWRCRRKRGVNFAVRSWLWPRAPGRAPAAPAVPQAPHKQRGGGEQRHASRWGSSCASTGRVSRYAALLALTMQKKSERTEHSPALQVDQAMADGGAPAAAERDSAAKLSAAKAKPAGQEESNGATSAGSGPARAGSGPMRAPRR